MIQRNETQLQVPTWQKQLAKAIKDPEQLLKALDLPANHLPAMQAAHKLFPLRVTESFLSRIEKNNLDDPLLRQIIPWISEAIEVHGFEHDPVGDKQSEMVPGLLHKYKSRVLLTLTAACGVHCRYCFRRHFDYSTSNAIRNWQDCLDYIMRDTNINEVIFSGGDPLSLSDHRLSTMIEELNNVPHLNTLRIHTRQIVILPSRIDSLLLEWINNSDMKIVIVVHINHANEINTELSNAISKLLATNVTILNQSVLLNGINDNIQALTDLSRKLFEIGILPYYLHMLDKVQGAAHFSVKEKTASQLMDKLRIELPGYLVPKLVRELVNEPNKTPII